LLNNFSMKPEFLSSHNFKISEKQKGPTEKENGTETWQNTLGNQRKARPVDKVLLPPQHMQKQRNTEQARERAWASTKTSLRLNLDHTAPRTYRRRKKKRKECEKREKEESAPGQALKLPNAKPGTYRLNRKRRKEKKKKIPKSKGTNFLSAQKERKVQKEPGRRKQSAEVI